MIRLDETSQHFNTFHLKLNIKTKLIILIYIWFKCKRNLLHSTRKFHKSRKNCRKVSYTFGELISSTLEFRIDSYKY